MADEQGGMDDGQRRSPARSVSEIERDIARSRADLGATLTALGGRLSARYLVEKGLDMISESIREGRAARFARGGFRADPVPLALIGFGLAWIVARHTGAGERDGPAREAPREAQGRLVDLTGAGRDRAVSSVGHPVVDADGADHGIGWVHQAAGATRGALRTMRDTGGAMFERAGGYAGLPTGRLRDYADAAGDRAGHIGDDLAESFERHPLLFGAAGILAGAALAGLLPSTKAEEAWLGEARERVWMRIGEIGRDAADRIRNSVGRGGERAAGPGAEP